MFLGDSRGLDTFAQFQSLHPELPILVMSGLDDERVAETAVHNGAQDYLVKGQLDEVLLSRSVRYAIERKRVERTRDKFKAKAAEYTGDKEQIKQKAEEQEKERDTAARRDPYFDYAEVLLQIAIVLCSVSILSASLMIYRISVGLAALGALYTFGLYAKIWEYRRREEEGKGLLPPITNVELRAFKQS